jgi:hypothetical protein
MIDLQRRAESGESIGSLVSSIADVLRERPARVRKR